jgi:hypothetical protein
MKMRRLYAVSAVVLALFFVSGARADITGYTVLGDGTFGTLDLATGAFLANGSLGQTGSGLGVANGSLFAASYNTSGTLFRVNQANGTATVIGNSGVDYHGGFGSTLSGLYAVGGPNADLYSINALTGVATDIGPTGIGYGAWRDISTNSSTLYYGDGADLYTLNTSTGAATLVGAFGNSVQIGPLLTDGGILYGLDEGNYVYTIDTSTGAATLVASAVPHGEAAVWGIAPTSSISSVPEPSTWAMMFLGFIGLGFARYRKAMVGTALSAV